MFSFLAFVAVMVLFALLMDTRSRLGRAEATLQEAARRIGALQRHTGLVVPEMARPEPPAEAAPLPKEAPILPMQSESMHPASWSAPKDETDFLQEFLAAAPAEMEQSAEQIQAMPANELEPIAILPEDDGSLAARPASTSPRSASGFEQLFGRKLPIWAGGITLAIAGVLIVKYAIDAGFFLRIFTHGVQIVSGLLFGTGLIAGAEFAWRNEARVRDVRVPQALSGAGIATLYASVLVAANAYHLIAPLPAFVALAAITASALGLSLRFGAPSAVLGLVGGLAAPALVSSASPDVPLLAIYLGVTIASLAGVARAQRWPWLAALALVGGAGWSLGIILIDGALDMAASLSVGGLVLVLAVALPALALDGPRNRLLRSVAAIIGAVELAVLVAHGGFEPLHWGLFALLALAGQWLAWRDRKLAIVPGISLALSALLLAIWPNPSAAWFALIALALAAIHALPLLMRLWRTPASLQNAVELSALALAAPALFKWQYMDLPDSALALVALGGAAILAAGIGRGWRAREHHDDWRFALLTATAGGLITLATALVLPAWLVPLGIALIAAAMLFFGEIADDWRIEPIAFAFAGATLAALLATTPLPGELNSLISGAATTIAPHAVIRWTGLAALFALFAARSKRLELVCTAQALAGLLAYGAIAQMVPLAYLPLVPAAAGAVLLLAARRLGWARTGFATGSFAGLSLAWAFPPFTQWSAAATLSLAGLPMTLGQDILSFASVARRLLVPALLFGAALWHMRDGLPAVVRSAGLAVVATIAGVALHCLYRLGFAHLFGTDFAATGLSERIMWEALLIGGAWAAWHRAHVGLAIGLAAAGALHTLWYTLLLHDPLWATQAVGAQPGINLLIPAFALMPLSLAVLMPLLPQRPMIADRLVQGLYMLLIALFTWASLRQAFHGSWLNAPGVFAAENILRSLLILGLAIGFLLWGIRSRQHDWRIASLVLMLGAVGKVFLFDASGLSGLLRIGSFVALGFSLIGIGWLYSRQLTQNSTSTIEPTH